MIAALAIRSGLPGTLREDAYILPPDLSFEEWSAIVKLADHIVAASPWWLADAMAYGEDRFAEEHSQALPTAEEDPHGVSQARMKQAAWMARKYPPVTRVTGATYTHHRIVADMAPGDRAYLLSTSAREQWSTRDLTERVKAMKQAVAGHAVTVDGAPLPGDDLEWVPVRSDLVDECRARLEIRLSEMDRKHRVGFESGWLAAHVEANALGCLKRDGES